MSNNLFNKLQTSLKNSSGIKISPKMAIILSLFLNLLLHTFAIAGKENTNRRTTIVFSTLERSGYAFDIYTLPVKPLLPTVAVSDEFKLTDGNSVNFNGHFPSTTSSSLFPNHTINLMYVTERNGSSAIYLDSVFSGAGAGSDRRRSALQIPNRVQIPVVGIHESGGRVSLKDRPNLVGEYLVYVSTHENSGVARASWTAVYSTHIRTKSTRRLTPVGVADFSPAVSPSGIWTAVASSGERVWGGEIHELKTDIYVFKTRDGSERVKIVEHGGWPCWVDEFTLYFHRESDDGWWSVYTASLPENGRFGVDSVRTRRVTPPGLHAFTPAASITDKSFIAVATRRVDSDYRHIELFNLETNEFLELTRPVSPRKHHYNPFISPDSTRVGYHKCRGGGKRLILENILSPLPEISLFRLDGYFPSFSPNGDKIAYIKLPGLYVVNTDGSGLRLISSRNTFSTAWHPKIDGLVYTSVGPTFKSEDTKVDIVSININDPDLKMKFLTRGGENNAFPAVSPDGKWVVFRSGRSGKKNLYIMDSIDGESGGIHRLTEGPWSDTMCNWSPDGEWIAFASDRENPGSGSFELFLVHPNGTGLRKLVQSGVGGRTNHPWFSPDGKRIVFTSDYSGVSAEPIANPNQFQPYGDIFSIGLDGYGLERLTHNSYEDGTPTWGPIFMKPVDVEPHDDGSRCLFDDSHWLTNTITTKRIQCS
ncbi:uncharacterized protein LOC124931912 [Impatiens glandulifera]|uniref:uncharacterized protein LOC124931912 n=1 Tax=Impatiens glandulifera TaxID=253017 RepID=UPI001FB17228|nr:uncharacterized protein LOC124931912 [Impatiens glandulifera]